MEQKFISCISGINIQIISRILPKMKTKQQRTMGLTDGTNRSANASAPTPNAPASKVAKPLFMPLLKVAPSNNANKKAIRGDVITLITIRFRHI